MSCSTHTFKIRKVITYDKDKKEYKTIDIECKDKIDNFRSFYGLFYAFSILLNDEFIARSPGEFSCKEL
jgi:hypothetical protein